MKKVVLATNNEHKLEEFQAAFAPYGYQVLGLKDIGYLDEIEESKDTFEGNARIKAQAIQSWTDELVIADDSGLEIDFYNGKPGVYSHRFLGVNTPQKIKNQTILKEMEHTEQRGAQYVCVIVCLFPDGTEKVFHGEVKGEIYTTSIGESGFGYDPIFYYPPFQTTLGNVSGNRKSSISHRGKAMNKLLAYLEGGK